MELIASVDLQTPKEHHITMEAPRLKENAELGNFIYS